MMVISLGQTNIRHLEEKNSWNVNNILNTSLTAAWLEIILFSCLLHVHHLETTE